jgi:5-methyltetrahydrofolate--homocysteine methyltransferase
MFYAIWGVKYGSAVPEAMELMQLRRDAEEELAVADFKIMLTCRFFPASANAEDEICFEADGNAVRMPMMRQENGQKLSLADFVTHEGTGHKSPFGMFAICVHKRSKAHVEGCSCPACSNQYEEMIGKTVRMTLAEAASKWLDENIKSSGLPENIKIIKPAVGYASCPDHTLKEEILRLLCGHVHWHREHTHKHGENCSCGHHSDNCLGIELTESYAMTPEASICGLIFMHPEATYPQIRRISQQQYDNYVERRGMDTHTARRFLGHLLK